TQEAVDYVVDAIETGWSGTYTTEGGSEITVNMNVVAEMSEEGGVFSSLNFDQIELNNTVDKSQITSEGKIFIGGVANKMTNTLKGGITRGEMRPAEMLPSWGNFLFGGPKYPGTPVHEWGHLLGFVFHRGWLDNSSSTDAMDTAQQQPSAYQLKKYQMNWFLRVGTGM
ncbi:MAG: hypothetical protein GY847_26060, partial [Proteobacteria bacterium]|nr:hypothetical protein [Pseudomonadota bacterium]